MTERGGYFLVEARWEHTHNPPGEDAFFYIDEIGGSLDDAKRVAQSYIDRHIAQAPMQLEWIIGITRKHQCYYARTEFITFRVTR